MSASANRTDNTHYPHHSTRSQWLVVIGFGLLVFVLGTRGFSRGWHEQELSAGNSGNSAAHHDWFDAAYHSIRLFHLHFEFEHHPLPLELQIARFLAPVALGLTLFKGFLFAARGHHRAFLHASTNGHVVICGLGEKGLRLVREFRSKGQTVVVVEIDASNPRLHHCDEWGIFYWITA